MSQTDSNKLGECWIYAGYTDPDGYGKITTEVGNFRVHRLMYVNYIGEVPEGLVLDHLCEVTSCINPEHLEPVTQRVNVLRGKMVKDHCPRGHKYTSRTLHITPKGHKRCKRCWGLWRNR